jgi:hypothetical protein
MREDTTVTKISITLTPERGLSTDGLREDWDGRDERMARAASRVLGRVAAGDGPRRLRVHADPGSGEFSIILPAWERCSGPPVTAPDRDDTRITIERCPAGHAALVRGRFRGECLVEGFRLHDEEDLHELAVSTVVYLAEHLPAPWAVRFR